MSAGRLHVAALLLVLSGCAPAAAPQVDDATVVDAGTHLAEMAAAEREMTAALKTVVDERTARDALPKLSQIRSSNLAGARYARAVQLGKVGAGYEAQEADWLAALSEFKSELDRIRNQHADAYQILTPFFLEGADD